MTQLIISPQPIPRGDMNNADFTVMKLQDRMLSNQVVSIETIISMKNYNFEIAFSPNRGLRGFVRHKLTFMQDKYAASPFE